MTAAPAGCSMLVSNRVRSGVRAISESRQGTLADTVADSIVGLIEDNGPSARRRDPAGSRACAQVRGEPTRRPRGGAYVGRPRDPGLQPGPARAGDGPVRARSGSDSALDVHPGPDLDAPIAVLAPAHAKGLGFDSVVVVDPAGIEQASPRGRADLYVTLTRTTRRLGLVTTGDLPTDLAAALS
jgi:hypothetical protein